MKNNLTYLTLLILLLNCCSYKSKIRLELSVEVCNKLYVEAFNVFGSGAFGGDLISDYLTDSTNFRIYIGTFDNADFGYAYKCKGDSIIVKKINLVTNDSNKKIIETRVFSLSKLKKEKIFE